MSTARPQPPMPPKLLSSTSMRLRLAGICLGILALGAAAAPERAADPLPSPEQGPAPLLGEQMARTAATAEPFAGVQEVADRTRTHAVAVVSPAPPTAALFSDSTDVDRPADPDGFGVYVAEGFVLTHADALGGRTTVRLATSAGTEVEGRVAAAEADTGLVLLQVPPGGTPATLAAGLPPAGALAVGAGRVGTRDVALPVFVTSVGGDRFSVGATSTRLAPGSPLFSSDGDLLAVASGTDQHGDVFPAAAAVDRLLVRASTPRGVFGLAVQGLDARLTAVLGDAGVVVTDAVAAGPAAAAGIAAGDVIVGIADATINSAPTAAEALTSVAPGQATTFRIVRQGRERSIEVTPVPPYALAAARRPPDAGPLAGSLMSDDELRAAAIPGEAIVIRVGTAAVTSVQQGRRLVSQRRGAVAVLLSRNEVRFMTVLPERP